MISRKSEPDLLAALEAAERERDDAQKALRTVQNAAKTLAHSRDSELQHLRENSAYDHKLRAEHESLIERDALMTARITALEVERDALKADMQVLIATIADNTRRALEGKLSKK